MKKSYRDENLKIIKEKPYFYLDTESWCPTLKKDLFIVLTWFYEDLFIIGIRKIIPL